MKRGLPPAACNDPTQFMLENMRIAPAALVPEIRLYTAHPGTGLRQLTEAGASTPPYWAYQWAGGTVLARHFLDRPETVRGRRVLDLGAGSGIVGIAAALAGAKRLLAADIDPLAIAALRLNTTLNGATVEPALHDFLDHQPPDAIDLVAVGDLFYDRVLAGRATRFLDRCRETGIEVLIGDPGRAFLPRSRLHPVADYAVPDFGSPSDRPVGRSSVYVLGPDESGTDEEPRASGAAEASIREVSGQS